VQVSRTPPYTAAVSTERKVSRRPVRMFSMRFASSFALLSVVATLLSFSEEARGQDWARKMFETTKHEFGVVAKDSKTTYDFVFVNKYVEDVHVASVRASCGCTTPIIVNRDVKTWEKGVIRAQFNTDRFTGQRGATITVTFDRPFFAEVQLRVDGYIRSDLVFNPGQVEFATVDQGVPSTKEIEVVSFGKSNWKIQDVRSVSEYLSVQILDEKRQNGKVTYRLGVNLKDDAPAGYLQNQLTIVTNDPSITNVPIVVSARVQPSLTVSPQSLYLGDLQPGEVSTKNLVVKSKAPIRIAEIVCDNQRCTFKFDPQKLAQLHVVPVTLTGSEQPGKVLERVVVRIENGAEATFDLSATIFEGDKPASTVAVDTKIDN
jgi:hypothetical protein